jgi:hypothetical protein
VPAKISGQHGLAGIVGFPQIPEKEEKRLAFPGISVHIHH